MPQPHELLTSWRDGPSRDALSRFLIDARDISPDRRVAVFDNDGTLWCEKPMYTQADFFVRELHEAAAANDKIATRPEYAAILKDKRAALAQFGLPAIALALVELFEGMAPEEYERRARAFILGQQHPTLGTTYAGTIYQPMLELLRALRAAGFATFIVSGGGVEFVRAISQELYSVPPEGVIGTGVTYEYALVEGRPTLTRTGQILGSPNEGPEKVSNIQYGLGRRPMFAAGNSAGDKEMLEYAVAGDAPSLALLVDHDDEAREFAYDSVAGTFDSNERIADVGRSLGWVVVSMKDDWNKVFVDG